MATGTSNSYRVWLDNPFVPVIRLKRSLIAMPHVGYEFTGILNNFMITIFSGERDQSTT